jgi:predicted site-specific integrase-resolvase
MKTLHSFAIIGCFFLASLLVAAADDRTNTAVPVIGLYDSRAVIYAQFSSAANQKALREQIAVARAARQAGDTNKFEEYRAKMRATQDQVHRQLFSTAPVQDALATIKDRIPELQKTAGVSALVSRWDETTLQKYTNASRIDVTDRLVREFIQPDEKQMKTISSIEKSEPLSLEKCDELIRKGQL